MLVKVYIEAIIVDYSIICGKKLVGRKGIRSCMVWLLGKTIMLYKLMEVCRLVPCCRLRMLLKL